MKKILPFSLIINALFIIVVVLMITGPIIGNTFNKINSDLSGGAPAQDLYLYDSLPMEAPAAAAPEQEVFTTARDVNESVAVANAAQVERIVIKNADLIIVVADVEGRMKNIQIMAEQLGGFVVSSNLYESYTSNYVEVPEAQIVVRVPSEKLEEAMNQIKKDVVEVQSETVSGQDVTAEYVDLKSRLKNLEAAEAQLDEILKTATETEDVVNVFNQLVYYREQIELVKGQIKYYDEAAALSSISVRIIAEATVQPLVIGKWEPKGVALEAVQDLIDFLQGFTEFLIRFVIFTLPALIIIAIPLYLLFIGVRALARKLRGNKARKQQPEETPVEKK